MADADDLRERMVRALEEMGPRSWDTTNEAIVDALLPVVRESRRD